MANTAKNKFIPATVAHYGRLRIFKNQETSDTHCIKHLITYHRPPPLCLTGTNEPPQKNLHNHSSTYYLFQYHIPVENLKHIILSSNSFILIVLWTCHRC